MAGYDQSGKKVSDLKLPFSLRFVAHPDVKNLFPTAHTSDSAYVQQLASVPADSNLYNIWAYDKPKEMGGSEKLIGTIKLRGSMVASGWGDANMFFRH